MPDVSGSSMSVTPYRTLNTGAMYATTDARLGPIVALSVK
jgi:hypothetical protein